MITTAERIDRFIRAALAPLPVSEANLAAISDHLVEANLIGMDSHGLQQILGYARSLESGRIDGRADPLVIDRSPATVLIDGARSPGQRAAAFAMTAAIEAASEAGVCLAAVRNSNHFGMAGHYTRAAARAGLVGFATSDTNVADLAPFGGAAARVGNNPVSWGFPTGGAPFVLDVATGVVSGGKVAHHGYLGRAISPSWGLSADGEPVATPESFAVARAGSHKMAGLALAMDLLCGPLLGTASSFFKDKSTHDAANGTGHLLLAIEPRRFAGTGFIEAVDDCLRGYKEAPRRPGVEEILYPGELEERERATRTVSGIPIPDRLVQRLRERFGAEACAEL